jgi:hypothetical protein
VPDILNRILGFHAFGGVSQKAVESVLLDVVDVDRKESDHLLDAVTVRVGV